MDKDKLRAIMYAILAAVLYAISTPVSKTMLVNVGPVMMAAFLYLGAGIGIGLMSLIPSFAGKKREKLAKSDLLYTIGMIVLDIAAPILLMFGIAHTTAANASLLNNFEIVATSVIAFFVFREQISRRMWLALALVTLSSAILSFEGTDGFSFSAGSLLIIAAACCWGLENNCTRMISSKNTFEIVILKGLFSGSGSLVIALITGEKFPAAADIAKVLILGFVAYGLSIFFYIRAQNVIGAAKTSAYYALAPFIAALLSFVFLHESLTVQYLIALAVMIAGSALATSDTFAQGSRGA